MPASEDPKCILLIETKIFFLPYVHTIYRLYDTRTLYSKTYYRNKFICAEPEHLVCSPCNAHNTDEDKPGIVPTPLIGHTYSARFGGNPFRMRTGGSHTKPCVGVCYRNKARVKRGTDPFLFISCASLWPNMPSREASTSVAQIWNASWN